ncbi:N-acetyltransferase [Maribellus sp. CM-23]|uniref:GNAT family N-acetyltransferase n=1 Tax=Maribellus sp. CM-23 TaxID=2781026 RepID=UPI001F34632F|nr:GNAT family N-acetyltransferase [Maribellus sp. CM-23]MCE4564106.1 N-acetyltransferase [Maribellus sp. CM-23]
MEYELINNEEDRRYEFQIDDVIAKIEYIRSGEKIYLTHTEVPIELEGKGIASSLAKKALADIQEKGLKLVPLCPFVNAYIRRHTEWEVLVLKD